MGPGQNLSEEIRKPYTDGALTVCMARSCHAEGMRERREMRNHSTEGKADLVWIDGDGRHNHIARYGSGQEAQEAKERLTEPSNKAQSLIGVPANPTLKVILQ